MAKQYASALRRKGKKKLFDIDLEESLEAAIGVRESYNRNHRHQTNFEMVVVELKVIG